MTPKTFTTIHATLQQMQEQIGGPAAQEGEGQTELLASIRVGLRQAAIELSPNCAEQLLLLSACENLRAAEKSMCAAYEAIAVGRSLIGDFAMKQTMEKLGEVLKWPR